MIKKDFFQKVLIIFVSIFLTHVCLEIAMRMVGKFLLYKQSLRNTSQKTFSDDGYKILCIGESTTMLGGENSYPRVLERYLNNVVDGIHFEVVNKGLAGTNTDAILGALDQYLKDEKPNMVLAMMGINDEVDNVYELEKKGEHQNVSQKILKNAKNLRIYKLYSRIGVGIRINLFKDKEYLEKIEKKKLSRFENVSKEYVKKQSVSGEKFSNTLTKNRYLSAIILTRNSPPFKAGMRINSSRQ